MSAAHTPGPWRVTGPNVRAGDALLAMVTDHWANEKTPDAEKMANARLIAAAPELLAALHALVGEADLGEIDHDDDTRALIERARDAIERATGVPV